MLAHLVSSMSEGEASRKGTRTIKWAARTFEWVDKNEQHNVADDDDRHDGGPYARSE